MKFLNVSKQTKIGAGGTSYQGGIDISYKELVKVFGLPTRDTDGYKVDAEWLIIFDNGVMATIYNYKDGKNYCGDEGLEVEDITDWHIGGKDRESVDCVIQMIAKKLKKKLV